MKLRETIDRISPVSQEWMTKARERLDNLTKPRGSLGMLETLAARYVAIRRQIPISMPGKEVFVFVGDHDVVNEGVSAYPQEVTALMVKTFLGDRAAINVLARSAGAKVSIIDIGMKQDLGDDGGLIRRNVRRGARNIALGPAMEIEEAERAIEVGIEMAEKAKGSGTEMVATGEMGIGNTTPSAAIFAAILGLDPSEVAGRGTGLDEEGYQEKVKIIEKALEKNRHLLKDPVSILAALGGLEIAGICGLCLGGAANRMAVMVDGFISSAGALVAMRLNPLVRDYLFFSHRSLEKGHGAFFEAERIRPMLDLDLRLGEGTGAAIAMQIMEDSFMIFNDMSTFEEAGIEPGA
ncbi:MAG: nicotinate-nucleotide--dimethylbenzimidazole phosphoribosyltransferase [Deltaproteobacteria bacterium]|nr:nicotinate-nucleotide--dimethylbenzimidazole phosphoribosyltransferase [Deltaproteobacteria bacterium]